MRCLYFGCWSPNHKGHFLWNTDERIERPDITPWQNLDCALAPGVVPGRPYARAYPEVQGHGSLHRIGGWTAFAFWDRTGDCRAASNSVFLLDQDVAFPVLLEHARLCFPHIFARLEGAGIDLLEVDPAGSRGPKG